MSREPWSDERLHDAYAALVARPTPPGLEEEVMSELRGRPVRASRAWWHPAALLPAAAALTAVVVVAVALFSGSAAPIASPPTGSAGPSASGAMASATPAASPSPDGSPAGIVPGQVLGLPVITVARMLELTDEGTHAGEVFAVGGWYTPPLSAVRCAAPTHPRGLLELFCAEATARLSDRPHQTFDAASSLVPKFVEGTLWVDGPDPTLPDRRFSIPVVILGHVGDERAALCPAETRATCEHQFVVDRVAWAGGSDVSLQLYHDVLLAGRTQPSVADAESFVEATMPGATVLSISFLSGPTIRRIEPTQGYEGDGALLVLRVIGPQQCGLVVGRRAEHHWSEPLLFTSGGERVQPRICF